MGQVLFDSVKRVAGGSDFCGPAALSILTGKDTLTVTRELCDLLGRKTIDVMDMDSMRSGLLANGLDFESASELSEFSGGCKGYYDVNGLIYGRSRRDISLKAWLKHTRKARDPNAVYAVIFQHTDLPLIGGRTRAYECHIGLIRGDYYCDNHTGAPVRFSEVNMRGSIWRYAKVVPAVAERRVAMRQGNMLDELLVATPAGDDSDNGAALIVLFSFLLMCLAIFYDFHVLRPERERLESMARASVFISCSPYHFNACKHVTLEDGKLKGVRVSYNEIDELFSGWIADYKAGRVEYYGKPIVPPRYVAYDGNESVIKDASCDDLQTRWESEITPVERALIESLVNRCGLVRDMKALAAEFGGTVEISVGRVQ